MKIIIDCFAKKAMVNDIVVNGETNDLTKQISPKLLFPKINQFSGNLTVLNIYNQNGQENGCQICLFLKIAQDYIKTYRKLFPSNKTVIA